jgi:hypothetical protein
VADDLEELYAAPLDEFTALRNALAKRTGDARIKQLKKPSVAAWAVNQLARRREVDLRRLLRAGEALEATQKDVVRGGDQRAFERARADERDAVRRLRSAASELLQKGGHPASDQTLERVAKTLRAGAATEQGRRLLREGRLGEELESQGFDALASLAGGTSPGRRAPAKKERGPSEAARRRAAKAREAAAEARREADEAAAALAAAERELERARRAAERAAEKADRLEAKASEAAV